MRFFRSTGVFLVSALCAFTVPAQSNFDPARSIVDLPSIGALHWAPAQSGAVIDQFYASGHIYGANVGWISLGNRPADKFQYQNNSANDFGVNVAPDGALRGFAYGANIGWIHFEPSGNPRVDWISGRLAGRAWAANLGWIDLETATDFLRLESLPAPADSDHDGMADAWEIFHANSLTSLDDDSDADADGLSDLEEYLAGTDPFAPSDVLLLRITSSAAFQNTMMEWQTKPGYVYFIDQCSTLGPSSQWSAASERIVGTGSAASVTVPLADGRTFYRVRAHPPLSTL